MSTIPVADIPTLSLLFKAHYLKPASSTAPGATFQFNDKISLIRTDITKLETDAIVNAANESLLGGGGVDGAIHRAAGPDLLRECEALDGCDTGSAKITNAYRLPCKRIIHAVGPVYYTTKRLGMHTTLLQSCYTTSLDLAVQNDCKSIAFSALSTGIYGYPSEEAAEAAIQAVKRWLVADEERAKKIERVVFCQFMEKDEDAYAKYIPVYFSPAASSSDTATSKHEQVDGESTAAAAGDHATEPEKRMQGKPEDRTSAPIPEPEKGVENIAPIPATETTPATDPSNEKVLDLPDVPTKEPAEPGEPESKKLKLDGPNV